MGQIDFGPALEQAARSVAELHASPSLLVVYATGAGAGIQTLLWEQPGASRTLLDAQFPYSREALVDLLGEEPQKYCSQETAIRVAIAAHARCRELAIRGGKAGAPTIGLGLTASVATGTPKRGEHRVHIAVKNGVGAVHTCSATFAKDAVDRTQEGMLCDLFALNAILCAAGLASAGVLAAPGLIDGELVGFREVPYWQRRDGSVIARGRFLAGPQPVAPHPSTYVVEPVSVPQLTATIAAETIFHLPVLWPDGTQGTVGALNPVSHLLFPGSFNPLHFGHEQMVRHAERMTGRSVVYTMNARHPDKGEIAPDELLRRAEQFRWRAPVLFTQDEPLFIDKARRFPGFGFLIGADVVLGLLNPTYYGGTEARDAVLREFHALGTRFYVVGREVDGAFRTIDDIVIPASVRDLFMPVSGRWDVASRNLR